MYEKYNILTLRCIQENYYTVVKRRKTVDVRADFVIYKPLLTLCKHDVDVNKENVDIMSAENERRRRLMAVFVRCSICGKVINTDKEEYKENLVGECICNKCSLKEYEWKEKVG